MPNRQAMRQRAARIAEGRAQAAAERTALDPLPSQGQLLLPLLRSLDEAGGTARPSEVYDTVARHIDLDEDTRHRTGTFAGGKAHRLFDRQVRHAQQFAMLRGLVRSHARGQWSLTDKGYGLLENACPGRVITVFQTSNGVALWARIEDAAALIEPGSVDMIFTSPPYPVLTRKAYGGLDPASWLTWMVDLIKLWKPLLVPGGSLFLNVGGEIYRRGQPFQSIAVERLVVAVEDQCGLALAQRWFWDSPTKLATIEWAGKQRLRLRQTIEPIYWWVHHADGIRDHSDNSAVLQPYKAKTRTRYIGKNRSDEARLKPSGIDIGALAFAKDNGGSIPSTLISAANSASSDPYRRACRQAGLPLHPATFPLALPERAILMATQPGDLVLDPFLGSGTTAAACEKHGRRWIGVERSHIYLMGAAERFPNRTTASHP